jgi:Zn-dependent protease
MIFILLLFITLYPSIANAQNAWYIPSSNHTGTTFNAPQSGIYRFTIVGGAYIGNPQGFKSGVGIGSEDAGWETSIVIYKNRQPELGPVTQLGDMIFMPLANWDYSLSDFITYPTYEIAEQRGKGQFVDIPLNENDYVIIRPVGIIAVSHPWGSNWYYDKYIGGVDIRIELMGTTVKRIGPPNINRLTLNATQNNTYTLWDVKDNYLSASDENGVILSFNDDGHFILTESRGAYKTDESGWKNAIAVFKNRPVQYGDNGVTGWDYLIGSTDVKPTFEQAMGFFDNSPKTYPDIPVKKNDTLTLVCIDSMDGYEDNIGGFSLNIVFMRESNPNTIPEEWIPPIAAVSTGVGIGLIGTLLNNFIDSIFSALKSYTQKWTSVREVKIFGIMANIFKKPIFFSFSLLEVIVGIFSVSLLGITFLYVDKLPFIVFNIALFIFIAGITWIIHELAHYYFANRYGTQTELRFWGIGSLALVLTTLLFGVAFGSPARIIINNSDKLEKNKIGIINLAGPIISLVLSIIFALLILLGRDYAFIGVRGLPISMIACVFSLIPIEPMEGKKVLEWNEEIWALIFLPALVAYIAVIIYLSIYMA